MDVDLRLGSTILLLGGWIALSGFGIVLYLALRGIPREVVGARLFMHVHRIGRGFLLLSIGFATILLVAFLNNLLWPGGTVIPFAGSLVWAFCVSFSIYHLFVALYVPRSIRTRFGPTRAPTERAGSNG